MMKLIIVITIITTGYSRDEWGAERFREAAVSCGEEATSARMLSSAEGILASRVRNDYLPIGGRSTAARGRRRLRSPSR
jgi:hypothetical protein